MIYFDSAATTLQKPQTVGKAVWETVSGAASPGRGNSPAAARASEILLAFRETAGELFGINEPEKVILTGNATHGLNIAVKSLVKPGGTVLLSGWEHNAVTRPLAVIPRVKTRVIRAPLFRPDLFLEELARQLTPDVNAVVCTHVSNVFGYVLPVEEIAALCRQRGVPLLIDASQSAGVLPLRMKEWGAAFLAMPGHKSLYGPQGTGILLCRDSADPLIEGGTGSQSLLQEMPDFLPDRLEAGTHNVPGAAGLLAGMRFVAGKGTEVIRRHETALKEQAAEGLEKLSGVQVWRSRRPTWQTGVLSFRVEGQDVGKTGDYLAQNGIAVRTGLHCAPLAHETVGTVRTGTVRLSFSAFNTPREVERFLAVMAKFV